MAHERILIPGSVGDIEVFVESRETPQGVAIIAHPHPLHGGTADNKVVTTLARAFRDLGCITLRPNFRGIGATAGKHDHGMGESEDLYAVHAWARKQYGQLPFYLAGFSFGAFVITRLAKKLADTGDPAQRLVLVATAVGHAAGERNYATETVPADTVVIHGAEDDTVPLDNVLEWAEPQELPIVVVPGAEHFFHRKLHILRAIVRRSFQPAAR